MSTAAEALVLLEVQQQIATLTLNRAQRHNALVPDLLSQLEDSFNVITAGGDARVIILKAAGPSFSTGGDLQGFREHRHDLASYADRLVGLLNQVVMAMINCELPIVVAVDGQVCGGALGLVLGGDIVVVTRRASFRPWYVDVGFSPDGGWTALLPRLIGRSRAAGVQLLNEPISASQAVDWGLAWKQVDCDTLDESLERISRSLLGKIPGSIASTRSLLRQGDTDRLLDDERRAFVSQVTTEEALRGLDHFLPASGEPE